MAGSFKCHLNAFGIGGSLIPNCLQVRYPIFQTRIIQRRDTCFDRVVKPVEALIGFRDSPVQFGQMFAAAFGSLLPPIEKAMTALTAKMARVAHAVVKTGTEYRPFLERSDARWKDLSLQVP